MAEPNLYDVMNALGEIKANQSHHGVALSRTEAKIEILTGRVDRLEDDSIRRESADKTKEKTMAPFSKVLWMGLGIGGGILSAFLTTLLGLKKN